MTVSQLPLPGAIREPGKTFSKALERGPTATSVPGSMPSGGTDASQTAGCVPPVEALYMFALLRTGDCATACDAVSFAVAGVVDDPTTTCATPSEVWVALTDTMQNYSGWDDETEGAAAALRRAAFPDDQSAILALIGAGLTVRDVAALLGIGVGAAKHSFDAGVRSLGAALKELEPTRWTTRMSDGPS